MEQPLRRVDVVVLEIEALQPRILPRQSLALPESFQKPLLGNPIDATEKQLGFGAEGIEGVGPTLKDPVCLGIAALERTSRVVQELVLNIERGAGPPVFQLHHGAAGALV